AAIVDCYLRLTTTYLPPERDVSWLREARPTPTVFSPHESEHKIKLRFEWDWKGVERERRRANELKTDYPSPHQWHVAYRLSETIYREAVSGEPSLIEPARDWNLPPNLSSQLGYVLLTPSEEVQILCAVARDQIAIGNYQAAAL